MATTVEAFDGVAVAVAASERTAELLGAPVCVVDRRGIVVASSEPRLAGLSCDALPWPHAGSYV